jgi:flavodoxin
MNAKTLIICKSIHHQNTQRVAQAMADVLSADLCPPEEVAVERLAEYGLLGFGSGVYYGRVHQELRDLLDRIPAVVAESRDAFVFTTSGLSSCWRIWHQPVKQRLREKGYRIIGEFHCPGHDTFGPLWLFGGLHRQRPDDRDLENARSFARSLHSASSACA